MKQLLTNRKWHIDGRWYEPQEFLQKFKSVVRAEYLDMSSSAGDWYGYFLQKLFGKYYLIIFWQTNSYPDKGFDLMTDNDFTVGFDNDKEPTKEELDKIACEIANF